MSPDATGTGPLAGLEVAITRPTAPDDSWSAAFDAAGARLKASPLFTIVPTSDREPMDAALARLPDFAWIAFTSAHAVAALANALRSVSGRRPAIAVVGPATAAAVRALGVEVDLEAKRADGAALARALVATSERPGPVLIPSAADARPELAAGLEAASIPFERVVAYEKKPIPKAAARLARWMTAKPSRWVVATSPRMARALIEALKTSPHAGDAEPSIATIGPTTASALDAMGVPSTAMAATPTPAGVIAAIATARERRHA